MSQELRVALVQNKIVWNELETNLQCVERLISGLENVDMVVLPEMFATGFMVNRSPQDENSSSIVSWMRNWASRLQVVVVGSLAVLEQGNWFNRLFFVLPDGSVETYDKRHLFCKSPEPNNFKAGSQLPVFQYKDWKICPQICYDLRFPVWSRNRYCDGDYKYDVLLYVANWPAVRTLAWQTLLAARAIENQCFVVGCNVVGTDAAGQFYTGDSRVISYDGTPLALAQSGEEQVITAEMSKEQLVAYRDDFPVAEDWDM